MQSQRYKPSSWARLGTRCREWGDIVQVALRFLSDRTGSAQATLPQPLSIQGDGRGQADVGVCHSFGDTTLYVHPVLCLYSLQQSYSPELPESCPCLSLQPTQADTFPWITLGQPPNYHNSYRLRELWGDAADHKQFCLCIPKTLLSPYAEACSDLITLHQAVLGCEAGSVWLSKNCGGHGLVGQTSVADSSLGAKRSPAAPKLSLDTHSLRVLGVLVQLSCAPGPPCPEHGGTFQSQLEVNQRRYLKHI